jgi:uncharacterized protein YkwD
MSFSQTRLDSLVLVEINSYRNSKGLDSVKYSDINFKSSNHHSKYLVRTGKIGHTEDTLVSTSDRVKFYGGRSTHIGENVSSLSLNVKDSDDQYLNKISKSIVKSWIESPEHNKMLLSNFKFAGVSCITTKKSTGIKGWSNISVVSTLVLTN